MSKKILLTILFLLVAGSALAIELSFPIPCQSTSLTGQCAGGSGTDISDPATYVARIYQFGLLAAGITALGAMVFGATKYILSAGNVFDQGEAKNQILSAIYGVLLLLGAYLILNTINPDLVKLKNPTLTGSFTAQNGAACVATNGHSGTFQNGVCVTSGTGASACPAGQHLVVNNLTGNVCQPNQPSQDQTGAGVPGSSGAPSSSTLCPPGQRMVTNRGCLPYGQN